MTFGTIEQAIEDLRNGKIIIVADDEDRENEGDLVCAAELVTPEMVNFMATHGRGLICLALTPERCDQLGLPQMAAHNTEEMGTAFTVSIDADRRFGVTTGISAADRAATIHVAINPATVPGDLRRPGHVFPLRARPGGVLQRVGQTEASVDLARLAGLYPAGVICEILNPDGTMARRPAARDLRARARAHLRHRRPAGGLPAGARAAGAPGRRGPAADRVRRVPDHRLPQRRGPGRARRAGAGRGGGPAGRPGADALEVPDRRRLRLAALRLRPPAARRHAEDLGGRRGRDRLPRPGGPRHRPAQQAQGLRAAGRGAGHRAGQPAARLRARPAQLRHRGPDPPRPRPVLHPADDQQSPRSSSVSRATAWRSWSGSRWSPTPPTRIAPTWTSSATSSATS